MAAAALEDNDSTTAHVAEARATAESMDERPGAGFGHLAFRRMNVKFWEVALAVEQSEPGRVVELRESIVPDLVPERVRQATYWADLGRGLALARKTREDAAHALLTAEKTLPVKTHANPYVRESVVSLLRRGRRDDGTARELRGMAYRMGIAG